MWSARYSCEILMKLYLLYTFRGNTQISNLVKIRRVLADLFLADRQTDMTNLIVTFRNSAKASENQYAIPAAARIAEQFWFQQTARTEGWSNWTVLHVSERKRLNDPVRCANGRKKTKTRKQYTQPRTKATNFLTDKESNMVKDRSESVKVKCTVFHVHAMKLYRR
jgi:hypothetical protein